VRTSAAIEAGPPAMSPAARFFTLLSVPSLLFRCRAAAGLVLLAAAAGSVAAEAPPAQLEIADGHVREMPPGHPVSAAFFTLHNRGDAPLRLVGGRCDCADTLELHRHRHHNGAVRMEAVPEVEVAPGQRFAFEPGGYHVMLIGLTRPLRAGDAVTVTLIDAAGQEYRQRLPVERMGGVGHDHGPGDHHGGH
jgi:copper(I)-binding protein